MTSTTTPTSDPVFTQHFWLHLLIGPSASRIESSSLLRSPQQQQSLSSSLSSSSWLWILTVATLAIGQCLEGGWHALFAQLERFVVPFYTGLVILYLTILIAAGPLESLYHWLFTKRRRPSQGTKTTTTARPTAAAARQTTQDEPSSAVTPAAQEADSKEAASAEQPFDLSGAYKLVKNDNFDGFLAVQGVPWALRRAANQARPVHRITHKGSQLTIKIEGIIESQTTYIIGGPPVETNVRGRIFEDVVRYLHETTNTTPPPETRNDDEDSSGPVTNGDTATSREIVEKGIRVSKTALTEDYDVTVTRVLSADMKEITMTSRAVFRDDREPVQCIQKFQRIE